MQIIKLSQEIDREAWLDARRGLITGTKAKGVKPLTRGSDRTPAGFWELLAENLAVAKDGEPEKDRGLRLQREAIEATAKQYNLKVDFDPGMWISDFNKSIAVSPDAAEVGNKPKFAIEAKCLDSKNHLKIMVKDRQHKRQGIPSIESLKVDGSNDYIDQILQYFIVNEDLQIIYFTLYDDRMAYEHLMHYVIEIKRADIEHLIDTTISQQEETLKAVKELVKELVKNE